MSRDYTVFGVASAVYYRKSVSSTWEVWTADRACLMQSLLLADPFSKSPLYQDAAL
jgi:hypothetical protein